jgi:hypothetical protein
MQEIQIVYIWQAYSTPMAGSPRKLSKPNILLVLSLEEGISAGRRTFTAEQIIGKPQQA